jgi:2-methylisocitrate lyase-like PEP mutase family enzyme
MDKITRLRELLASDDTLVMPDAYDPLSARIIESLGFQAVQCSGYSFALANGIASEAAFGFERNLALTADIVKAVGIPVMADGEDGFGDPAVVARTVRAYAAAGVAGINIEDQLLGQPGPKSVIDRALMVEKLRAAREAAKEAGAPGLIINARTDALAAVTDRDAGLEEAIARGNLYLESGGDLVFVIGVSTLDEVRTLVKRIRGPISIAAGMPGNIDRMSISDLRACGVARASLPSLAIYAAIRTVTRVFEAVRNTDDFARIIADDLLCTPQQAQTLSHPAEGSAS